MNRKKESYDRIAVGERIRQKRTLIGLSQDELAEQIDRAPKYISDIENKYRTIVCLLNHSCIQIPGKIFYTMKREKKFIL